MNTSIVFFTKKTYLERDDPDLFKKIAQYLTWVKQPKRGHAILEEAAEDAIDPLLGKYRKQYEDKTADKIVTEPEEI